ncbi:MAG: SMC-Scp complex subunit ScpB [Armatimonadetes bacterium]|nr:SMC-Scp complex subunit ScpB [Armatimonadota bacterium]
MNGIPEALEALLFVSDSPVTVEELAYACDCAVRDTESALTSLADRMEASGGVQLVQIAGGYQVCTKENHAEAIERLLRPSRQRLSKSALEVLAIVAYRQPITLSEIDSVRGVQSDHGVRSLVDKGLVEEVDRRQAPGRPILYGTTRHFLHQFKLNDLTDLPPLQTQIGSEPEPALAEVSA